MFIAQIKASHQSPAILWLVWFRLLGVELISRFSEKGTDGLWGHYFEL